MKNLELRKPYQLWQIIDVFSKEIKEKGFTNTDFNLYVKQDEDIAKPNLTCYMELGITVTDDDEEIYPDFVVKENLELFYDGAQFEDVLMNTLHQKKTATIDDFVSGLNYYMEHDSFKDF